MKEIIIYLADDGTVFNNEFDCQEYELGLLIKQYQGSLRFYEFDKTRIVNDKTILDGDTVFFIDVADEESLSFLKKLNEWNGMFYDIDSVGKWQYVKNTDYDEGIYDEGWQKISEGE